MGAILPLHALVIHQSHVGFVDQSGGLQAMTGALTFHVASRQAVEFVINDGRQAVESSSISITPGPEKLGHLATKWRSGLIVRWCGFPHCNGPQAPRPLMRSLPEKQCLNDSSVPPFAPTYMRPIKAARRNPLPGRMDEEAI